MTADFSPQPSPDLAALSELLEKATSGPWYAEVAACNTRPSPGADVVEALRLARDTLDPAVGALDGAAYTVEQIDKALSTVAPPKPQEAQAGEDDDVKWLKNLSCQTGEDAIYRDRLLARLGGKG